jgi:hypothetical protein
MGEASSCIQSIWVQTAASSSEQDMWWQSVTTSCVQSMYWQNVPATTDQAMWWTGIPTYVHSLTINPVFAPYNTYSCTEDGLNSAQIAANIAAQINASDPYCTATVTLDGDRAVCRGFYDQHATAPLQLAERMSLIEFQKPERM